MPIKWLQERSLVPKTIPGIPTRRAWRGSTKSEIINQAAYVRKSLVSIKVVDPVLQESPRA